ncbi:GNAT family N-acetyltransferase [Rhizobium sp. 9T]|uniref:GNAT family N-acetyltransferase n=1 Tax=Rhizobium croatiense TaxID=2867516 RepID=UPI001C9359D2|nr:GNAT family N-acetyltransferase [Rhizobium croatiense]MBY4608932.1 GNAT family N-acetyltransferase [Rhizobium croatiense]
MIDIRVLHDRLPQELANLEAEAGREGYLHIARLVDEWSVGTLRFEGDGERLLGAYIGEALVGVGGMSAEAALLGALRMRRFYVHSAMRGRGIGRALALALLEHVRRFCSFVTVHAGNDGAAKFWESLGFQPVSQDGYSHILELHGPGRNGLGSDGKVR